MTHTTRQQLDHLLDAALDLPTELLGAFVDEECPEELRPRLRSLLDLRDGTVFAGRDPLSDELARSFPPLIPPGGQSFSMELAEAPRLEARDRLGRWRVLRRLGHGGMGDVYLAEDAEGQVDAPVAVKVARKYGERIARHFEIEIEILRAIEHPNVVRLVDHGSTVDGRLYLVLELVEGENVDAHCDARQLSIEERLRLFVELGRAVEAVHEAGMVHRDLKPSNVLVSAGGQVKLLDFGIAKHLGANTRTGGGVEALTPDCASPEQFRGGEITEATDVYQLGVLLFVLLTGERPYELDDRHPAELQRVVCEVEPRRPSSVYADPSLAWDPQAKARAEARGSSVRGLRRTLDGELDRIVLKALSKDPAHRQATVGELLAEIAGYLGDAPQAFALAA